MLILEKIRKSYFINKDRINVLKSISLYFDDIGFIGIKGKSGSGKSTLLNIISSLEKPDSGLIIFNGKIIDDTFLKKNVSIIAQNNDLISYLNVKDNILIASKIAEKEYDSKEYIRLIDYLGLEEHLHKLPEQLSGGQKKRVSIARALLKDSSILLCDEPTGALHDKQAKEVMTILKEISKEKLVIIVSHDDKLLDEYCDHVLVLEDGILNNEKKQYNQNGIRRDHVKKYSLFFYVIKQMIFYRSYLLFLVLFEVIIIVFLSFMLTAMNGVEYELNYYFDHYVQKNILTIENFDNSPFLQKMNTSCNYDYILSLGEISIDGNMMFLPELNDHIKLYQGRLPENNKEIIVSYMFKDQLNKQISYKYNDEMINLKIVGVLEKDIFNEKCIYFKSDFRLLIPDYINKNMLVIENENIQEIYNELLTDYIVYCDAIEQKDNYLSLLSMARIIGYVFFAMSSICSFFLFYLTYQTLEVKRRNDYGIFLMLGLEQSKIYFMNFLESVLIALVMSFLGLLCSGIGYYYLNYVIKIKDIFMFSLKANFLYVLFIVIFYLFLSAISAYVSAKKVTDRNLISILREE